MESSTVISPQLVVWGMATRPLIGQTTSGDLHLVKPVPKGVLLAVVDGIGHGKEAAEAARTAKAVLESHAEESLHILVGRCHAALRRSRGVVMTVAFLNPLAGTLSWLGVGNVEALLVRADATAKPATERSMLRSGLVGYQMSELRVSVLSIAPGDLLVFVTDGIGPGFARGWEPSAPPQDIADHILERHFRGNDDALVLVVRYLGAGHE